MTGVQTCALPILLFNYRNGAGIKIADVESYRNISKEWRDEISKLLVGRVSTSSQKFQDNIFEANAMPPSLLDQLAKINNKQGGIVENYIYHKINNVFLMLIDAYKYLKDSGPDTFVLDKFLSKFTKEKGLKRSIDKIYEITVYALFSTMVRALKVELSLSANNVDDEIMEDFEEFIKMVIGLTKDEPSKTIDAKLYRVGVTNAADRGDRKSVV